jgi:hypothetical protein
MFQVKARHTKHDSPAAAKSGIEAQLIESITTLLDDPSPIGVPIQERGSARLPPWRISRQ